MGKIIQSAKENVLTKFNAIFLGIVIVFGSVIWSLTQVYDAPAFFTTSFYSKALHWATLFFVLLFVAYRIFYIMIVKRPRRLTLTIFEDLKTYFTWQRFFTALPMLLLIPIFFSLFTTAKNMIPVINPFSWDPFFAEMEAWMHFGKQPWEWLQPILGYAVVTMVISFFYKLWFVTKFFVMYWQTFSVKNPALREQFFISLLGIWIVNGVILATLLSSAGPCYYGLAYPDLENPFQGLMTYLYSTDNLTAVFDLQAQEFLWQAYQGNAPVPFSGISAMPSMHVSLAFLFVLLAWRYGTFAKTFFVYFFIFTMIGSVHLGWHYAADGYLSILTTIPIWYGAGWLVRKYRS